MNEKPSAWTPEEKIALFAAVEQCRATGGQLDWGAIAVTVPGRSAHAAEVQYDELVRTPVRTRAPAAPVSPPLASCGVRVCGAAARSIPWIEADLALQFV